MIICHPPHPSHLSQDQDWISRTFLEQVVLVVAAQILSLCLKWYLPSDTLLAGNQYLCDEWCQGKDVLLSIRYFTSEVGCPHIVESWTRMMEFLNKDCSIHYDIPFLGKFSQSVFVFFEEKKFKFIKNDKVKTCMFWKDNNLVRTQSWNCRTEASSEKIFRQKRKTVDVKSPGWHQQRVGLLKWVSSIWRGLCLATRLFTLNYLSFSTICVRATWVSKRHQLFWRKLSERTRRIFLLLSMHVTTFSIVVTPTLGRVLIF